MESLPLEVSWLILDQLSYSEVLKLGSTSHSWLKLCLNQEYWRKRSHEELGIEPWDFNHNGLARNGLHRFLEFRSFRTQSFDAITERHLGRLVTLSRALGQEKGTKRIQELLERQFPSPNQLSSLLILGGLPVFKRLLNFLPSLGRHSLELDKKRVMDYRAQELRLLINQVYFLEPRSLINFYRERYVNSMERELLTELLEGTSLTLEAYLSITSLSGLLCHLVASFIPLRFTPEESQTLIFLLGIHLPNVELSACLSYGTGWINDESSPEHRDSWIKYLDQILRLCPLMVTQGMILNDSVDNSNFRLLLSRLNHSTRTELLKIALLRALDRGEFRSLTFFLELYDQPPELLWEVLVGFRQISLARIIHSHGWSLEPLRKGQRSDLLLERLVEEGLLGPE